MKPLDLNTKHCEIDFTSGGGDDLVRIYISASDRSIQLKKGKDKDDPTTIELTDSLGWDIFAVELTKWSLRVCLVKKPQSLLNYI